MPFVRIAAVLGSLIAPLSVASVILVSGCPLIAFFEDAGDGGAETDAIAEGDDPAGADAGSTDTGDTGPGAHPGGLVADHVAASAFDSIPDEYLAAAQSRFRIFYGHTSHGSQIITGMEMLQAADGRYAMDPFEIDEYSDDLGSSGDVSWVTPTRTALNRSSSSINLVMWSWCGGVSGNSSAGIDAYLSAMSQLERDYPTVTFIYMTGHLDGSESDENLYARNNQIRDYCRANGKVLFDFADIESYDPDGRYYPDGSDACEWCATWCQTHNCPACGDCAHSHCFNCHQKGRAFWWLLAKLAGWT